jgi:hypothetical protein
LLQKIQVVGRHDEHSHIFENNEILYGLVDIFAGDTMNSGLVW